jgi:hypothetical protein
VPWTEVANTYHLTNSELELRKIEVKTTGQFTVWNTAYDTWWNYRTNDGNISAAIPPADVDLPNGSIRLDVAETVDPASYPHPESWTPLKIGIKSQKYLTFNWVDVISPALKLSDLEIIYAAANTHYPTSETRISEIGEVVEITNTLSDVQKVIAEFWAGGPGTVSPPGMCVWLWKHYIMAKTKQTATFIMSGLDLTLHLFETGRVVWGLKKSHMEARPIQEIRRIYRGEVVKKYDGSEIMGENWVPYQESNFVTPPFADFPSGHSAFSRSFANVMNRWFGHRIHGFDVVLDDIQLISPALKPQNGKFGSFRFEVGDSLIQPTVVPSSNVTLSWKSWDEMAISAGLSRKYGGIHATSAHTGSVSAADALHNILSSNFPIIV